MIFIACPLLTPTAAARIDEDVQVLRLPPDLGAAKTALVEVREDGEADAFYRGAAGYVTRRGRLMALRALVEEERAAAAAEGRLPRLRALVPDGRVWDVADIFEPLEAAGEVREIARHMPERRSP